MQNLNLSAIDPLSITTLLTNLVVGALLALFLRWHFRRFGATLSNKSEFAHVGPFILLITILIITVVKSSLALSLGLVGALSIVRFRTPIKEPEELAYLFMAIAIGLGLGANQTMPTVIASPIILGFMAFLKQAHHKTKSKNLFLSIHLKNNPSKDKLEELSALIHKHASVLDLRRFNSRTNETEATFHVDIKNSNALFDMEGELRQVFSEIEISFIDHNQDPTF
jgi:uncharacterized membrane protein YhiD involved in acid resistance